MLVGARMELIRLDGFCLGAAGRRLMPGAAAEV